MVSAMNPSSEGNREPSRECHMEYVIVGNGIAGTCAAEAIREVDPDGHIRMVGDEKAILSDMTVQPCDLVIAGKGVGIGIHRSVISF